MNAELSDWNADKKIAGVSSFGVGGTNVHVVLAEEETIPVTTTSSRPAQLMLWSAKSQKSLDTYGDKLVSYLDKNEDVILADVAYTLQTARENFSQRRFVVASGAQEFVAKSADKAQFNLNTNNLNQKLRTSYSCSRARARSM